MNAISLSIFFPAHNEEENIRETIERALAATRDIQSRRQSVREYEIIVVDDGSEDRTADIAREVADKNPHIRIIEHARNEGYGAALKTGISGATQEYVFFTDADLQFDVREIEKLLEQLDGYDAVIGYRAPRQDPWPRLVLAWGWNRLNRLLFGLKVRDIDCAFKLIRSDLVQNLPLSSGGAMISAEMLIRLQRQGARIKEVPVSHMPRKRGHPTGAKPSVILRAFQEMVRLYQGDLGQVTQKQAMKFIAVGIVNTLVDLSTYILLTRSFGYFAASLVAAKFISFLLGTISSFILNRHWTFGLSGRVRPVEVAKFYTVASLAVAINTASMYTLLALGLHDLVALIGATVVTFAFNFTLSKFWVFRTGGAAAHSGAVPR